LDKGQLLAIWLHDAAAKLFLGLHDKRPVSRWAVVGTVMDDSPIGVWVDVKHIAERRPVAKGKIKQVAWTVHPGQCLIRWDYIITAQRIKESEPLEEPRATPGFL
jgi:hypothetical protein